MKAPFPWFGGKSAVAAVVWRRLGSPRQYIEPFCGSAAILLAAPAVASLEVIGDANCYVANFWRALKLQPDAVIAAQDYPVSHIDLFARHRWLTEPARVATLRDSLLDPEWPGDAKIAGWWLWGQCCWIGSGWCDPARTPSGDGMGKIPRTTEGGIGIRAKPPRDIGHIPFVGNPGMGAQKMTAGKIPHVGDAGRGTQRITLGKVPHSGNPGRGTQTIAAEASAAGWLRALADRLARVRIIHGDWSRCLHLSHNYDEGDVAVFLDPPYPEFEKLYGSESEPVAHAVAAWARDRGHLRIALCGHRGDYDMPGWTILDWTRPRSTQGSTATRDAECIWFSPGCLPDAPAQASLFVGAA
jgi:hypothetical protein